MNCKWLQVAAVGTPSSLEVLLVDTLGEKYRGRV
jgi:hypothetical protein